MEFHCSFPTLLPWVNSRLSLRTKLSIIPNHEKEESPASSGWDEGGGEGQEGGGGGDAYRKGALARNLLLAKREKKVTITSDRAVKPENWQTFVSDYSAAAYDIRYRERDRERERKIVGRLGKAAGIAYAPVVTYHFRSGFLSVVETKAGSVAHYLIVSLAAANKNTD